MCATYSPVVQNKLPVTLHIEKELTSLILTGEFRIQGRQMSIILFTFP